MPRREKQTYNFGPNPVGQVGLVDQKGQPITDSDDQTIQTTLVKDKTSIAALLEEQIQELRRIRLASELVLDEEVEEVD